MKTPCDVCKERYPSAKRCSSCGRIFPTQSRFSPGNPYCLTCDVRKMKKKLKRDAIEKESQSKSYIHEEVSPPKSPVQDKVSVQSSQPGESSPDAQAESSNKVKKKSAILKPQEGKVKKRKRFLPKSEGFAGKKFLTLKLGKVVIGKIPLADSDTAL